MGPKTSPAVFCIELICDPGGVFLEYIVYRLSVNMETDNVPARKFRRRSSRIVHIISDGAVKALAATLNESMKEAKMHVK